MLKPIVGYAVYVHGIGRTEVVDGMARVIVHPTKVAAKIHKQQVIVERAKKGLSTEGVRIQPWRAA